MPEGSALQRAMSLDSRAHGGGGIWGGPESFAGKQPVAAGASTCQPHLPRGISQEYILVPLAELRVANNSLNMQV